MEQSLAAHIAGCEERGTHVIESLQRVEVNQAALIHQHEDQESLFQSHLARHDGMVAQWSTTKSKVTIVFGVAGLVVGFVSLLISIFTR